MRRPASKRLCRKEKVRWPLCGTETGQSSGRIGGRPCRRAAFPVAVRYGMKGSTVDGELDLWRAVRQAIRRQPRATGGVGGRSSGPSGPETVYETALRRGFTGPFLDLELALWRALADAEPGAARNAG